MLKKRETMLFVLLFCLFFLYFQNVCVLAYDFELHSGLGDTGYEAGYNEANLTDVSIIEIIGKVIRNILLYIGVFFLLLSIYAGFIWMFSRGNEQEVEKAKKILENAIIGLIIVLLAYAVTYFIMSLMSIF